jgi:hypothetical protein
VSGLGRWPWLLPSSTAWWRQRSTSSSRAAGQSSGALLAQPQHTLVALHGNDQEHLVVDLSGHARIAGQGAGHPARGLLGDRGHAVLDGDPDRSRIVFFPFGGALTRRCAGRSLMSMPGCAGYISAHGLIPRILCLDHGGVLSIHGFTQTLPPRWTSHAPDGARFGRSDPQVCCRLAPRARQVEESNPGLSNCFRLW